MYFAECYFELLYTPKYKMSLLTVACVSHHFTAATVSISTNSPVTEGTAFSICVNLQSSTPSLTVGCELTVTLNMTNGKAGTDTAN